jgi:hypothetical protein
MYPHLLHCLAVLLLSFLLAVLLEPPADLPCRKVVRVDRVVVLLSREVPAW